MPQFQALECAIQHTVVWVNLEDCGKDMQCKISGWNVGFSRCPLHGYCKPASSHTVTGESRNVP